MAKHSYKDGVKLIERLDKLYGLYSESSNIAYAWAVDRETLPMLPSKYIWLGADNGQQKRVIRKAKVS